MIIVIIITRSAKQADLFVYIISYNKNVYYMVIRKEFRVESAHIVRNCTSERCSHSIHGHSAVIELFFESDQLDNAQMVMDFGLMKTSIKQFVDSMDHCYLLCDKDRPEFKEFITKECDRYIVMPFNPSAEMLSLYIFKNVSNILELTNLANGEQNVKLKAVRYHETITGYAECNEDDLKNIWKPEYDNVRYSEGVRRDWSDELTQAMQFDVRIQNPTIPQQIKLN